MAERATSPGHHPPYLEGDWDATTQRGDQSQLHFEPGVRPDDAHPSTEPQRQPSPGRQSSDSSHGSESGEQTDFDGNMPDFHREKEAELDVVVFADGDPGNPKNWSKAYKWYVTMVVAITCFAVAFCSSVITADVGSVAEEFNVSYEAALVPISVFVVGFGIGKHLYSHGPKQLQE